MMKTRFDQLSFIALAIYTVLSLVFFGKGFAILLFPVGAILWGSLFWTFQKKYGTDYALIQLVLLSIPLSFINIFNQPFGSLPISWFFLFVALFISHALLQSAGKGQLLFSVGSLLSILVLLLGIVPLLLSPSFMDGLMQYVDIAIALLILISSGFVSRRFSNVQKEELLQTYVKGAAIAAIGLIVQIVLLYGASSQVGYYALFGGTRQAFGFLFTDYSFLSLYLASAAAILFVKWFEQRLLSIFYPVLVAAFMLASLFTSARTGIAAFLLFLILYSGSYFFFLVVRGSVKSVLLLIFNLTVALGALFILSRIRSEDITSDSGRGPINETAFELFSTSPLFGIGFGTEYYANEYGTIPHNVVIQFLAQSGLLFTIPLLLLFVCIGLICWKHNRFLFSGYITVLLGALFIPDVFSSRFLTGLLLVAGLYLSRTKEVRMQ